MAIGPLQLVVISFDNVANFQGQIQREIDAIRGRGVIKLIDALFVRRDAAGQITTRVIGRATDAERAAYGAALQRLFWPGGPDSDSAVNAEVEVAESLLGIDAAGAQALLDTLPPGAAAAVALFEHRWAAGLAAAIGAVGGHVVAQGLLTRDAALLIGAELEAIAAAEAAIELAATVKSAALLDALAFAAEVEAIKAEAATEAATAVAGSAATTIVAAETVRTLIVAGLLDEAEAESALAALTEAGLLDPAIVDEASSSASQHEARATALAEVGVTGTRM
jgi:hypothetical protein